MTKDPIPEKADSPGITKVPTEREAVKEQQVSPQQVTKEEVTMKAVTTRTRRKAATSFDGTGETKSKTIPIRQKKRLSLLGIAGSLIRQQGKRNVTAEERTDKNEEEEDPIPLIQYAACKTFVIHKLSRDHVLLRSEIEYLISKYGQHQYSLRDVPRAVLGRILNEICWVIRKDRYCLTEIASLKDEKAIYNQHRKAIIDWFNRGNKLSRWMIDEVSARKQWTARGLQQPDERTYHIIMTSVCFKTNRESPWLLKTGVRFKRRRLSLS